MGIIQQNITACVVTICGGILSTIFGITPLLFFLLTVTMVFDFITGIAAASKRGDSITSERMVKKAKRWGFYCITLASVTILVTVTREIGINIEDASFIYNTSFLFMFTPEMWSVFENLQSLGVPIPKQVFTLMEKISLSIKK